jgi:hypothetical protein
MMADSMGPAEGDGVLEDKLDLEKNTFDTSSNGRL